MNIYGIWSGETVLYEYQRHVLIRHGLYTRPEMMNSACISVCGSPINMLNLSLPLVFIVILSRYS
jgi:hypothetical protein